MLQAIKQFLQSPQRTIEELHNSFDTAADRLVAEAKDIIAAEMPNNNAILKRSLGFSQATGVKEMEQAEEQKRVHGNKMHHALYFQQAYPLFKVIHEDDVKNICAKYGLVMGGVEKYKGDVPHKNLMEMKNFDNWKSNIIGEDSRYERSRSIYSDEVEHIGFAEHQSLLKQAEEYREKSLRGISIYCELAFHSSIKAGQLDDRYYICAPLKGMDTTGMTVVGHKLMREIKDPIVLYPLRDGFYMIVTKWGLEASDNLVINAVEN